MTTNQSPTPLEEEAKRLLAEEPHAIDCPTRNSTGYCICHGTRALRAIKKALSLSPGSFADGVEAAARVAEETFAESGWNPDYRVAASRIASAIRSLSPGDGWMPIEPERLVESILRYGGRCRDCADRDGICETGMPCEPDASRRAIRHVLEARAYYLAHPEFLQPTSPPHPSSQGEEK